MTTDPDLTLALPIPDAAKSIGMSPSALRRLIAAGEIIARYPTSRPVVDVRELRAYLDRCPTERPTR